jgi:hypothetical protein
MTTLLHDLRFALRSLGRSRGFTAAAILCLGLGVGVNSTVFSLVNALLLRPFPFHEPDRVVTLYSAHERRGLTEGSVSRLDLADWEAGTRATVEEIVAFHSRGFAVEGPTETERVVGSSVSVRLFAMLGVRPALGRAFLPGEAVEGGARVVVLSDALWRRRFSADPGIVGRSVTVNGMPYEVVGVMPPRFKFPETAELWTPLRPAPAEARAERYLATVARLRPGVTVEQAHQQLAAVARRLAAEHPATNTGWGARAVSYRDDMVDGTLRVMLSLLLGAWRWCS